MKAFLPIICLTRRTLQAQMFALPLLAFATLSSSISLSGPISRKDTPGIFENSTTWSTTNVIPNRAGTRINSGQNNNSSPGSGGSSSTIKIGNQQFDNSSGRYNGASFSSIDGHITVNGEEVDDSTRLNCSGDFCHKQTALRPSGKIIKTPTYVGPPSEKQKTNPQAAQEDCRSTFHSKNCSFSDLQCDQTKGNKTRQVGTTVQCNYFGDQQIKTRLCVARVDKLAKACSDAILKVYASSSSELQLKIKNGLVLASWSEDNLVNPTLTNLINTITNRPLAKEVNTSDPFDKRGTIRGPQTTYNPTYDPFTTQ